MTKEQMSQELSSFVAIINGHTETMNKIKEGLQLAMRADANPSLLDDVKEVLRHLTEVRDSMGKVKTTVKARIQERIKG